MLTDQPWIGEMGVDEIESRNQQEFPILFAADGMLGRPNILTHAHIDINADQSIAAKAKLQRPCSSSCALRASMRSSARRVYSDGKSRGQRESEKGIRDMLFINQLERQG